MVTVRERRNSSTSSCSDLGLKSCLILSKVLPTEPGNGVEPDKKEFKGDLRFCLGGGVTLLRGGFVLTGSTLEGTSTILLEE